MENKLTKTNTMGDQKPKVDFLTNVETTLKFNKLDPFSNGQGQYGNWYMYDVTHEGVDKVLFTNDKTDPLYQSVLNLHVDEVTVLKKETPSAGGRNFVEWIIGPKDPNVTNAVYGLNENPMETPKTPQKPVYGGSAVPKDDVQQHIKWGLAWNVASRLVAQMTGDEKIMIDTVEKYAKEVYKRVQELPVEEVSKDDPMEKVKEAMNLTDAIHAKAEKDEIDISDIPF